MITFKGKNGLSINTITMGLLYDINTAPRADQWTTILESMSYLLEKACTTHFFYL